MRKREERLAELRSGLTRACRTRPSEEAEQMCWDAVAMATYEGISHNELLGTAEATIEAAVCRFVAGVNGRG
jgi:hypothetical protein